MNHATFVTQLQGCSLGVIIGSPTGVQLKILGCPAVKQWAKTQFFLSPKDKS